MTSLDAGDAQHALELAGIVAFALSGATVAIRKGFDAVGIVLLALLTALGGGVIRDLLIGATPPAAFRDVELLILPVVAALVAMVVHPVIDRLYRVVLLLDAAGLALFSVTGTLIAAEAGLQPVQAAFLGIVTCVGGGVLRDVVALEVLVLVRADSDLYAVPAALGRPGSSRCWRRPGRTSRARVFSLLPPCSSCGSRPWRSTGVHRPAPGRAVARPRHP